MHTLETDLAILNHDGGGPFAAVQVFVRARYFITTTGRQRFESCLEAPVQNTVRHAVIALGQFASYFLFLDSQLVRQAEQTTDAGALSVMAFDNRLLVWQVHKAVCVFCTVVEVHI